jgi:hypothetical protein
LIVTRVRDELVHGIPDGIGTTTVGETLNKGAELLRRDGEGILRSRGLTVFLGILSGILSVASILLNVAEEPANGLLIVVVLLALDDDLLHTEDELVAALRREVLVREELPGAVTVLPGTIFVLVRNATCDIVLIYRLSNDYALRR